MTSELTVKIGADIDQLRKELGKATGALKSFESNMLAIGGQLSLAFSAAKVAGFTFEVSKLAGEAEGVNAAFQKLPQASKLMAELKAATHGTVAELELMKRAVQANNFKINLQSLPDLLEFATLRAQQTGQSVDYLVDSIVTGIGRKSTLILDNLGISATRLKEKLGGVSIEAADIGTVAKAVGLIANEELSAMGRYSENAASKISELRATWEDFKTTLGKTANDTGILTATIGFLNSLLKDFSGANKFKNALESVGTALNSGERQTDAYLVQLRKLQTELGTVSISARDLEDITKHMKNSAVVTEQLKGLLKDLGIEIVGLNKIALGPTEADPWFFKPNEPIKQQIGLLLQLETKLKDLESAKKNAFSVAEIISYNEEIKKTKAEIDALNAALTLHNKSQFTPTEISTQTGSGFTRDTGVSGAPTLLAEAMKMQLAIKQAREQHEMEIDQMIFKNEEYKKSIEEMAGVSQQVGDIIGSAFGNAIAGNEDFAASMKKITGQVVALFFQQALAGIIKNGATTPGPPPVGVALAAAGAAAISAMFAKIGHSGSRGVSSRGVDTSRSRRIESSNNEMKIVGETRISGQHIDIVWANYQQSSVYTRS